MNQHKTWILILFVSTQFILQSQWLSRFPLNLLTVNPDCSIYCPITESCSTLCEPMDCSLPGSTTHGIFQARILEWVAIFFSRGSSQSRDWTQVSCTAGTLYPLSHQGSLNLFHFLFWTVFSADRFWTPWSHLEKGSVQGSGVVLVL